MSHSQVIPIYDLNDTHGENFDELKHCHQIRTCGGCVLDKQCGYCFNSNDIESTGRCLPRLRSDPLKSINNTYCDNGSDEDLNIYFTTTNCPR